MATVALSPLFNGWQGFGTTGLPLNAGQINTYIAGSSTPQATYTTSAGNVANANPIVLGTDGRPPQEVWLIEGAAYKFVLTDSLGNNVGTPMDNITAPYAGNSYFTATGTGAAVRTSAAVLNERVSLANYIQSTDTDLTSAFTRAIASIGANGRIIIPDSSSYPNVITGAITLPSSKTVWIDFDGYKLTSQCTGNTFLINNAAGGFATYTEPKHVIEGGTLVANSFGTGNGIQITDSTSQSVKNMQIVGFAKGISLLNTTLYTEQTILDSLDLWNNNYGIYIDKGAGSASFATTQFRKISVGTMASAQAAVAYGIYITTTSSIYRSFFDVNIFPDKTNSIAFYCDGNTADIFGMISIENTAGAVAGNTGFSFGVNWTGQNMDIFSDIRGTIATKFANLSASAPQGIVVGNAGNGLAFVRKQGVAGYGRTVYDQDLTTLRMGERWTAGDAYQWRFYTNSAANLPAMLEDSSGNVIPIKSMTLGSGTLAITTSTTPSVLGYDQVELAYAGGTNVTNFTGADVMDGRWLTVSATNGNATLVHSNTAGGICLTSGANVTLSAITALTLRYKNDRWKQYG